MAWSVTNRMNCNSLTGFVVKCGVSCVGYSLIDGVELTMLHSKTRSMYSGIGITYIGQWYSSGQNKVPTAE